MASVYYIGTSNIYPKESEDSFVRQIKLQGKQQNALRVFSGKSTIFILDERRQLWGLGASHFGQLGYITDIIQHKPINLTQSIGNSFESLVCGESHVLALGTNQPDANKLNRLFVWGENDVAQCATEISKKAIPPQEITREIFQTLMMKKSNASVDDLEKKKNKQGGSKYFTQVACSQQHSFLLIDQDLYAFGRDYKNRLGLKTMQEIKEVIYLNKKEQIYQLSKVPIKEPVIGVSCAQTHAVAWTEGGELYSWGDASDGKLGRGYYGEDWISVEPVGRVQISEKVIMASCATNYTFAISQDGELYGWGRVSKKLEGKQIPCVADILLPRKLKLTTLPQHGQTKKFVKISSGYSHFAALSFMGTLFTWGDNVENCCNDSSDEVILNPTQVSIPFRIKDISTGQNFTTFISSNKIFTSNPLQDAVRKTTASKLRSEIQLIKDYSRVKLEKRSTFVDLDEIDGPRPRVDTKNSRMRQDSTALEKLRLRQISKAKVLDDEVRSRSNTKFLSVDEERSGSKKQISYDEVGVLRSQRKSNFNASNQNIHTRPNTQSRPTTQQLSESLWRLLKKQNPQMIESRGFTPYVEERQNILTQSVDPIYVNFLAKHYKGDFTQIAQQIEKKGAITLNIDETFQKMVEKQQSDPLLVQLRKEPTLQQLQLQTDQQAYKFDEPDFYTTPVAKEFNHIKQDLLKFKYIDMIQNGHEERHMFYIFSDKPSEWKPRQKIRDQLKVKVLRNIPSAIIRKAKEPIQNMVTREDEKQMLNKVQECIKRAKRVLKGSPIREDPRIARLRHLM